MRAAAFFVSAFAAVAFAQDESSVAESEAPATTEAPSSSIDAYPQTSYLQQTNSLGVVTGQPNVETSQPAAASSQPSQPAADTSIPLVATSLPPFVSIPAVGTGLNTVVIPLGNNSTTKVIVSANNSTTVIYNAPTATGAKTTGSGRPTGTSGSDDESGRPTGSGADETGATPTPSNAPGAAANVQVAAGMIGAGLLAAFL